MKRETKRYRVIGRVRFNPGDVLLLDDPEQIEALIRLGVIDPKPLDDKQPISDKET